MILVRNGTATILQTEFSIPAEVTAVLFEKGILSEKSCRDLLIKIEYKEKAAPKEKQRLKNKLADKYCISVELVEKIIRT
jgi:hypothetical protein